MPTFVPRFLRQLRDVAISVPTDGQVPTFNESTGKWENADPTGGSGGAVDAVIAGTDIHVDATDPANPVVALASGAQTSLGKADAANGYTDAAVATEASARVAADTASVATSEAYTDTHVATEASARAAADTAAIATAEGYTDTQVAAEATARSNADAAEVTARDSAIAAAVANLINSAPGALDTLKELADAIGDDATFATTVTNALAGKQPLDSDLTAIAALTTTLFGRSVLTAADAAALRVLAGLGTLATQSGTFSGTSSGTNTGDQTSVSGNAGTATKLAATKNLDGQAFDGSADITVIAPGTHAASSKATPVDADELPIVDSAASNVLKKLTWSNLKATLKTYMDTLYAALVHVHAAADITSGTIAQARLGSGSGGAGAKFLADDQTYKSAPAAGFIGARVFHSIDQSMATGTQVNVAFNSERFDTDTIHDTATNNSRLTCKTAGKYQISGQVRIDTDSGGHGFVRLLFILLNGTTVIAEQRMVATAGDIVNGNDMTITTLYALAVNDYVELCAIQGSGVTLALKAAAQFSPEFMMALVGT